MKGFVAALVLATGFGVHQVSAIEIRPNTLFSKLPDSNLDVEEAFDLLIKGQSSSRVPGGYTAKELITKYSDRLIAESKQAGLPEESLRKAMTHCPDELPYAVSYVKIKGRPYWLISTRKMFAYKSEPVELTHGSNYLVDLKEPDKFLSKSCYCF